MKYLVILILLAGCSPAPKLENAMQAYEPYAFAVATTALACCDQVNTPEPAPKPKPTPDGKCTKCKGTGFISTDGTIKIKCNKCGGSGESLSTKSASVKTAELVPSRIVALENKVKALEAIIAKQQKQLDAWQAWGKRYNERISKSQSSRVSLLPYYGSDRPFTGRDDCFS